MNYKTLEYDWYSIYEDRVNSIGLDKENYFSSLISSSNKIHFPILYEKVGDNIKKFMNYARTVATLALIGCQS